MSSPLLIRSLGNIVTDKAFFARFSSRPVVFPDGVVIERAVLHSAEEGSGALRPSRGPQVLFSGDSGYDASCITGSHLVLPAGQHVTSDGLYFTGTVTRSPAQGPRFIITRSDDPVHKRYVSDKSATTAWRAALDEACRDFPQQREAIVPKDEKGKPLINGMRFYGLYLAEVAAQLRRRPNGAETYAALEAEMAQEHNNHKNSNSNNSNDTTATVSSSQKTLPLTLVHKDQAVDGTAGASRRARSSARREAGRGSHSRSPAPARGRSSSPRTRAEQEGNTSNKERTPCPQCGLTTAFCPLTGAAHYGNEGAAGRRSTSATARRASTDGTAAANAAPRRRGEVRLPRRPAKPRPRRSQQQQQQQHSGLPAGEKSIAEELHLDGLFIADDDHDEEEEGKEEGTAARTSRRGKRARTAVAADGSVQDEPPRSARRRVTNNNNNNNNNNGSNDVAAEDKAAEATASEDVSIMDLIREEVMLHPPLRPPLSAEELQKAAAAQQERWKAQAEQTLLPPPAVLAALRLPLVPLRRTHGGGGAAGRGGKGGKEADKRRAAKKGNGENATDEDNAHENEEEDDEEDNDNDAEAPQEGNKDEAVKTEGTKDEESTDAAAAAAALRREPTMVHPLEIAQFATSAAGRRYMKFMLQYTSERSRLELIKASQAAASGGGASAASRAKTSRRAKKADALESKTEAGEHVEVKVEEREGGDAVTATSIEATLPSAGNGQASALPAAAAAGGAQAPSSPTVPAAATACESAAVTYVA